MSRCNAFADWDMIDDESVEVCTRPETFALTVERGAGRRVDAIDRETAGQILRAYMRVGVRVRADGDHQYTIAVPSGRWHSAYLVELRPI